MLTLYRASSSAHPLTPGGGSSAADAEAAAAAALAAVAIGGQEATHGREVTNGQGATYGREVTNGQGVTDGGGFVSVTTGGAQGGGARLPLPGSLGSLNGSLGARDDLRDDLRGDLRDEEDVLMMHHSDSFMAGSGPSRSELFAR